MTRFKDFDAARAEREREPLRFKLGGYDFETLPEIPALPLFELATKGGEEGPGAVIAFAQFLHAIIIPAQREAMTEVTAEVSLDDLNEVARWIIEEMTQRPLANASPSPSSPPTNGESSNVVRSLNPIEARLA